MSLSNKTKNLVIAGSSVITLAPMATHAATTATQGADIAKPSGTPTNLKTEIQVVTNTMLLVIGIVAVIMLIVGGFRYVLSAGNENATKGAKDTILYAVIGIIVALLSFAIVNFVLGQFTN